MRGRWLVGFLFLMMAVGSLPIAAQSSCTISTRFSNIRLRAGHSTTEAVVGTMPRNTQLQVIERFLEPIGRRTRVWYRLVKEQAAPTATSEQVWVGGSVNTSGDCVNIGAVPSGAPPPANAGTSGVGGVLPQNGAWRWTLGNTVNVSCHSIGSADFSTSETMNVSGFNIQIASAANSFTVNGVTYSPDANGTWTGSYARPEVQATGTAYIRVDTSTSMLGDLVISFADMPDCSFKVPFWGAPQ